MLSNGGLFFPSKKKGLSQHTVDNEVSALSRLTFSESADWARKWSSLSTLMGVRIKQVELRKPVRAFSTDKENCL